MSKERPMIVTLMGDINILGAVCLDNKNLNFT